MAWQLGSAGDVSAQLGLPSVSLCGTMACVQAVGVGAVSPEGGGGGLRRAHCFIRDAVSFQQGSGNVYGCMPAYRLDRFSGVQSSSNLAQVYSANSGSGFPLPATLLESWRL
jgi:hypothetical protein